MRYRLRTLLIVLAILPPLLWFGWTKYEAWREAERQRAELERLSLLQNRLDLGMLPTVLKQLKDLRDADKANTPPDQTVPPRTQQASPLP
jgi:hypothetical protein